LERITIQGKPPLSIFFVILAVRSWIATGHAKGGSVALGVTAVCGWILVVAVVAAAFRG
jgi:hypothetical protein